MNNRVWAAAFRLSTGSTYEVDIAIFLFSKKRVP